MKQLLDFLPILAFFITYYIFDIYVGTAVLMAATVIQLILIKVLFNKIAKSHWIALVAIMIFGSLTLYLQDDAFIKWKVTFIYGLFALVIAAYQLMSDPIPKKILGAEIDAPTHVWRNISIGWALTCVFASALNYYIAFNLSLDFWVNFKMFGLFGLTMVLFILTGIYLYKYMPESDQQENS